jgi:aspartate/methionine/tyrosine aminotransferase
VVDEVYHPLYLGGSAPQTAAHLPHAIVLSDFSKSLCFSGLRIGWLIDRNHQKLEEYLNARSYFTISNSPITELLATFVVQNAKTILSRANDVIRNNMDVLDAFFAENQQHVGWVRPQGGTIAFPWLLSGKNSRAFCEAMKSEGVFLVPGDCFGMPAHFRIGFGAYSGDIRPAMQKIQAYLRK